MAGHAECTPHKPVSIPDLCATTPHQFEHSPETPVELVGLEEGATALQAGLPFHEPGAAGVQHGRGPSTESGADHGDQGHDRSTCNQVRSRLRHVGQPLTGDRSRSRVSACGRCEIPCRAEVHKANRGIGTCPAYIYWVWIVHVGRDSMCPACSRRSSISYLGRDAASDPTDPGPQAIED